VGKIEKIGKLYFRRRISDLAKTGGFRGGGVGDRAVKSILIPRLNLCYALFSVIPAKAGIHAAKRLCPQWIPAFAGMTESARLSGNSE